MDNIETEGEAKTRDWYIQYYHTKGADRNNLVRNPGVLFQTLAVEKAIVRTFAKVDFSLDTCTVLDVGCGGGGDIYHLLNVGIQPENITGVELLQDRVEKAISMYPNINFIHGDISDVKISNRNFDLVFESTMFAAIADDQIRKTIAKAMIESCRPGGYIILSDWRTPKPFDPNYKALTRSELSVLFDLNSTMELCSIENGALLPPVGRFLSAWLPAFYFTTSYLLPFLCGHVVYLLRKR